MNMFNSNILSENTAANENQTPSAFRNDAWSSFVYGMLEFNDTMHRMEVNNAIQDYRLLKEDAISEANNMLPSIKESEALQEAMNNSIKDRIKNAIQAIIDFVVKFINMLTQKDLKVRSRFKQMKRKTSKFYNEEKNNNSYTFTVFHAPSILDVDENKCRASLNNITIMIDRICRGEYESEASDASLAMAYKALVRCIRPKSGARNEFSGSVENAESFRNYVKSDIIYKDRDNMTYRDWQASIAETIPTDKGQIAHKLSFIKADLEKCQKMVERAAIVDATTKKNADIYISQIRAIVSSFSWYLDALYSAETQKLAYIMNTYNKIRFNNFSADHMSEAGMIHGEPFDSDTLFDNEDLNDFNRTEWLDLSLTTECFNLKFELDESLRRTALAEANIMVDDAFNKISRLNIMKEAELAKAGNAVANVFNVIRKAISSFIESLKSKGFSKYMQRNKAFIEKEFKIEKVSSKGDILAGIARIQKNISIIPFNYEQMKDDLKDKRTFFEKHILPTLKDPSTVSRRNVTWDSNMAITDYCKSYFGASMDESKYKPCEFTRSELEANRQNIISLLNNSNITSSINADLSKIEAESKKVASTTSNTPAENKSEEPKQEEGKKEEAKNESYFSVLYDQIITEADIDVASSGNNTENKAEGNKESGNDQNAALKNYVECYKDVLLSKLTAAQFIISECRQIIMAHAKSHMSAEQQKAENDIAAKEK